MVLELVKVILLFVIMGICLNMLSELKWLFLCLFLVMLGLMVVKGMVFSVINNEILW